MPELLEIESYRRHAVPIVGATILGLETPDPDYLRGISAYEARTAFLGTPVLAIRRIGKVMLVDTEAATLALRFGMTGRLLLDGVSSIESLEYSSSKNDPAWIRFRMQVGSHELAIIDPRRLGWVEVDLDETTLGPDAWSIDASQFAAALDSTVAIKSRLMDQRRIAGLGNLLTDDILWRAGLDPTRPSNGLSASERTTLLEALSDSLDQLSERGGSHTGDLQPERHAEGRCPTDGGELRRSTIGGRTAYWCPTHQR